LQRGIDGSEAKHISTRQYYREIKHLTEDLKADIVELQERKETAQEEHRRKFTTGRADFKVVKDPADKDKLVLSINRKPIGKWFKGQSEVVLAVIFPISRDVVSTANFIGIR